MTNYNVADDLINYLNDNNNKEVLDKTNFNKDITTINALINRLDTETKKKDANVPEVTINKYNLQKSVLNKLLEEIENAKKSTQTLTASQASPAQSTVQLTVTASKKGEAICIEPDKNDIEILRNMTGGKRSRSKNAKSKSKSTQKKNKKGSKRQGKYKKNGGRSNKNNQ